MWEFLRSGWRGWTRIARRIGDVQARLLLALIYFAIVPPFALLVRLTADPLALSAGRPHGWRPRDRELPSSLGEARRQS
jgi:hypothetical protein